jgi:hypothetical protein
MPQALRRRHQRDLIARYGTSGKNGLTSNALNRISSRMIYHKVLFDGVESRCGAAALGSVFQVHGVDAAGAVAMRKKIGRAKVLEFFALLPACLVGIEACPTAHHWSRRLQALGHTVRLMPPSYVKAYVKRSKNDANDAAAICEAVTVADHAGGDCSLAFTPKTRAKPTPTLCTLRIRRHRRLTQHSLPGGLPGLTWAGPAPADRASFAWRLPRRGRDAHY